MQDGTRPYQTPAVFNFVSEYFNDAVIALYYDMYTGSGMAWTRMEMAWHGFDAM